MDNTVRTLSLLKQALVAVGNDPALTETRNHIRQAMTKLESVEHKRVRREEKQTQYQQWWGSIVSGTTASPMSPQAAGRSLRELDAMISAEQKKIAELERQIQPLKAGPGLLQD